jgi:hypothetical protein
MEEASLCLEQTPIGKLMGDAVCEGIYLIRKEQRFVEQLSALEAHTPVAQGL